MSPPPKSLTIDQWATLYTEEHKSPNSRVVALATQSGRGNGALCPVIQRPSGRTYRIEPNGRTRAVVKKPAVWTEVR